MCDGASGAGRAIDAWRSDGDDGGVDEAVRAAGEASSVELSSMASTRAWMVVVRWAWLVAVAQAGAPRCRVDAGRAGGAGEAEHAMVEVTRAKLESAASTRAWVECWVECWTEMLMSCCARRETSSGVALAST